MCAETRVVVHHCNLLIFHVCPDRGTMNPSDMLSSGQRNYYSVLELPQVLSDKAANIKWSEVLALSGVLTTLACGTLLVTTVMNEGEPPLPSCVPE